MYLTNSAQHVDSVGLASGTAEANAVTVLDVQFQRDTARAVPLSVHRGVNRGQSFSANYFEITAITQYFSLNARL